MFRYSSSLFQRYTYYYFIPFLRYISGLNGDSLQDLRALEGIVGQLHVGWPTHTALDRLSAAEYEPATHPPPHLASLPLAQRNAHASIRAQQVIMQTFGSPPPALTVFEKACVHTCATKFCRKFLSLKNLPKQTFAADICEQSKMVGWLAAHSPFVGIKAGGEAAASCAEKSIGLTAKSFSEPLLPTLANGVASRRARALRAAAGAC